MNNSQNSTFDVSSYEQIMSLANEIGLDSPSSQASRDLGALKKLVDSLIDAGLGDAVKQACWHPNAISAGQLVRQSTDAVLASHDQEATFRLDLFVIPVILVVGAQKSITLPTVLPDVNALSSIFESLGVLGHCKNFGLANCLTNYEVLHEYPFESWRLSGQYNDSTSMAMLDFPESPIESSSGSETAHLRFLCGVALSSTSAPSIFETAGDIGRWGMKFAETVSAQLSAADCSVLALPRSPRPLIKSLEEGYWAVREVGFQLFASNALNHARLKFGEPDIFIDSSAAGKVLIRLSSLFDDSFDRTYDFPVAPYESHDQVLANIDEFLREIGIQRYQLKVADGEEQFINCET